MSELENVRILKNHVDRKQSTEYAVFFDMNGFAYRLDWELADSADVDPQHIASLMKMQIDADFQDQDYADSISTSPAGSSNKYHEYLADGWELIDLTFS